MLSSLKRTVMKKRTAIATLMVAAAAALSFAYWTSDGSGTGSATTGDVSAVTVHQTSQVTGLYPGGPGQDLSGNFYNPNDGKVYIGSVTAEVTDVTEDAGVTGTCAPDNFEITGTSNTPGEIASSASQTDYKGSWSGLSISLKDLPSTNQDACKNASLEITYDAHAS